MPWKKAEFRIVLVADALKETGHTADELRSVYGVQELTVEKAEGGPRAALRVPRELFVDVSDDDATPAGAPRPPE